MGCYARETLDGTRRCEARNARGSGVLGGQFECEREGLSLDRQSRRHDGSSGRPPRAPTLTDQAPGAILKIATMAAAKRPATYEDVLRAPPHLVAEVIDGELRLSPRPALPHAAAASALGEELGPPFKRGRGGPGGWIILDEPEIHLQADILVPDLGGWRRERLGALDAGAPYLSLAPDWVAEVVSPRTQKYDRTDKLRIYARERVSWAWLVDPLARTLEVMAQGADGRWVLRNAFRDDARVRAEPFDAIELDLAVLWADVVIPETP